jgi:outer membrane protein OmpA-like peptidoglycan-associated protein
VVSYLVSQGIEPTRLRAVGHSERNLWCRTTTNDTAYNKSLNVQIEFALGQYPTGTPEH